MFNGMLPGYANQPHPAANMPAQPSPMPFGGSRAYLPFYSEMGGMPASQPMNTGIVPPQMQPANQANQMYRQFIRGRLGIGGDPEAPMGYGANGNRPIVDWQPRPTTFNEAPVGTGGFYPGGGFNAHATPHETRPGGMGGYGGFQPIRRSLYDEIG